MPALTSPSPSNSPSLLPVQDHDSHTRLTSPLTLSHALKSSYKDLTPAIGREFPSLQLSTLLTSPERDSLLNDLAVHVSTRGVCFFRAQDITPAQMQDLTSRLSTVAGCPPSSILHIHPLTAPLTPPSTTTGTSPTNTSSSCSPNSQNPLVAPISSRKQALGGGLTQRHSDTSRLASAGWHTDISFEPIPSDYALLKMHTLPPTGGGDTLWASGYSIYDRLSAPLQHLLERCTAVHDAPFFVDEARRLGFEVWRGERGHPANRGVELRGVHPVVRTNPVTGWKTVYVNKGFTRRINEVTRDESDMLLSYLFNLVTQNHDVQVRYQWGKDDVALWDNRSTFHCATNDYEADRVGDRVCSLGEKPYLDEKS